MKDTEQNWFMAWVSALVGFVAGPLMVGCSADDPQVFKDINISLMGIMGCAFSIFGMSIQMLIYLSVYQSNRRDDLRSSIEPNNNSQD